MKAAMCPTCTREGIECASPSKVPPVTVQHLVCPEHQRGAPTGDVYFCPQPSCDTVYFDASGAETRKAQLVTKVWRKEAGLDVPVCHCFSFTAREIVEDARKHGVPRIPLEIRDRIRAGLCACELKNPRGTCCLGDVAYWVKQA